VAVCAIALGAVWMVLSPAPSAKPTAEAPGARSLAYQQAIAERDKPAEKDTAAKTDAEVPPFETVTSAPPAAADGAEDPAAIQDIPSDAPQDLASLPDESADVGDGSGWPDESDSQDMAAVPGGRPAPYDGVPPLPGEEQGADQFSTDDAEQWRDERGEPWANGPPRQLDAYGPPQDDPYGRPRQADPYGRPAQADPYGQGDPYGQPQADQYGDQQDPTQWADQNTEEWVEVIISGAPMRSTASEEAPMLFAFPYGRNLKVVSRYEGWVEVTDPRSAATGWMQAHVVAPSGVNRQPYGQNETYYDEPRREGGGWFKRNGGDFADMINRALGGGN